MATRKHRIQGRKPLTHKQAQEAKQDGALTLAVMLLCLGLMTGLFMILPR